jgi:hypothetical protein
LAQKRNGKMSVACPKIELTNKEQEMKMYPDNELTACPTCGELGLTAPNIWGTIEFLHKIPSPRFQGYFTFTADHKMSVA